MTRITSSRSSQTIVSECVWHLAGRDFCSAAVLDRLLISLSQSERADEQPAYESLEELARDLKPPVLAASTYSQAGRPRRSWLARETR